MLEYRSWIGRAFICWEWSANIRLSVGERLPEDSTNRMPVRAPTFFVPTFFVPTFVGAREFELSRQYVRRLAQGDDFPAPEANLSAGRVWTRAAVEKWEKQTGQL